MKSLLLGIAVMAVGLVSADAAAYMLLSQTNTFAAGITNKAKAYTDAQVAGLSGGTVGTVINTGSPTSGQIPVYSDTTGTNIAPGVTGSIDTINATTVNGQTWAAGSVQITNAMTNIYATASTVAVFDAGKRLTNSTVSVTSLGNMTLSTVGFTVDGGGAAISTGKVKGFFTCPYAATISGWNIVADTGTVTVKVWKIATGTAKPTAANSINTSGVALSSGTAIHSATLTDFTSTAVAANDIFAFNIEAVSGVTEMTFNLQLTR